MLQEYFYEDWSKVCLILKDSTGGFITSRSDVPNGLQAVADGYDVKPRHRVKAEEFSVDAYLNIYR